MTGVALMECLSVFGRAHTQCVQCAPKKARTLARQYQFEQGRRLALKSENHIPVPEDSAGRHYIIQRDRETSLRRPEEQCAAVRTLTIPPLPACPMPETIIK